MARLTREQLSQKAKIQPRGANGRFIAATVEAAGADAFLGYVYGMQRIISGRRYIDSALTYAHSVLASAFDDWMDAIARANPEPFAHVYEWPEEFQDYRETVGVPAFRLWRHEFDGRGNTASFTFMPSVRPSPVDPILLEPGPGGEVVNEGVHIFVWKAQAMEYAVDITVTPELTRYLAYVGNRAGMGEDPGWHHARENPDTGNSINFSDGPVSFQAGGEVHYLQFTTQFMYFWATMAGREFDARVRPRLQADVVNEAELARLIRQGNFARPGVGVGTFAEAERQAVEDLRGKQGDYISEARVRKEALA